MPRPPLPPKPSKIQKPVIPPKPSNRVVHSSNELQGKQSSNIKHNKISINKLEIDNSQQQQTTPDIIIRPRVYDNNRPTSLPPPRIPLSSSNKTTNTVINARPKTEFSPSANVMNDISIVAEGEIDPNYLVPAQTNAGDSLAPSSSTMNNDHVPLIPAPPLLTTHRILQQKVNELEEKIKSCKSRKQAIIQGHLDTVTEDSLDQMIAQYLQVLSELKLTLNGVRTIYMSAATIPSILQFGAHIIAYQITLIEATIFDAIPPTALLEHSSKHPHPRIVASTDFFNYITRCIEHSVLLPQEASSRAQLIHYWIKVASRCFEINNYQTLKAIISALNTPPVQRLKRTWAYIPKKSATKLDTLNDLMSETNNYGQYREHMGMVSTTVVNGKSVQLIRDEHYARPTVPFLGTFIHDITYLLAAFKSSNYHSPQDDPRIHEVLETMRRFQTGPRYTPTLPASFVKSNQKHHFRPSISNALHRGASRIQRFSGGNLFGSSDSSSGNNSSSASIMTFDDSSDDDNLDEQQKMATQYILMRPWVSQNTVDELSTLREPPQMKSNGMVRATSSGMNRTSSVFSSTSSNLRFSTGSVSVHSRPTSIDEDEHPSEENYYSPQQTKAPVVPPRPTPKPPVGATPNDELKAALAQRLAQVSK